MSFLDDLFGGSDAPQAPSYAPFISAFQDIAGAAKAHGDEALAWAKEQVASNKGLVDQVNKGLIDTQTSFADYGKQAIERGRDIVGGATDYLKQARDKYTDPTRVASDMGAAQANVGQAFDAARDASVRELEGYGINPADTRFSALDLGTRLQEAASKASAGTTAARQDEAIANQANTALLNQGNVDTQGGINLTSQGNAAGTGAVSNRLANTASGYQGLGTGLAWTQPQTASIGGAAGAQNQQFTNQVDAYKAEQASSSGLGSLAGAALGAMGKGGALASGGALAFLEDGGVVPDQVTSSGNPQGAIPIEASPSRGAVTDDVAASGPTGGIRLNGGEFIIPKDVVSWEGERALQALIAKARKGKEGAQARPAVGPAPPQAAQQQPAIG